MASRRPVDGGRIHSEVGKCPIPRRVRQSLIPRAIRTAIVPRIPSIPIRIPGIWRRNVAQSAAIVLGGIGRPIIRDGIAPAIDVVSTYVPATTVGRIPRRVSSAGIRTIRTIRTIRPGRS
jgi:hypothetical protein